MAETFEDRIRPSGSVSAGNLQPAGLFTPEYRPFCIYLVMFIELLVLMLYKVRSLVRQ